LGGYKSSQSNERHVLWDGIENERVIKRNRNIKAYN